MDYRVYHPKVVSEPLNVNTSVVLFDANGISETLIPEDYFTLLSIPGYRSVEELLLDSEPLAVERELRSVKGLRHARLHRGLERLARQ